MLLFYSNIIVTFTCLLKFSNIFGVGQTVKVYATKRRGMKWPLDRSVNIAHVNMYFQAKQTKYWYPTTKNCLFGRDIPLPFTDLSSQQLQQNHPFSHVSVRENGKKIKMNLKKYDSPKISHLKAFLLMATFGHEYPSRIQY